MSIVTPALSETALHPSIPTFCPQCQSRDLAHVTRPTVEFFRDEEFTVDAPAYVCQQCGLAQLDDPDIKILRKAVLDAYRKAHGLLTSDEIKEIREFQGLTQDAFANRIKVGVASLKRWEIGSKVQTIANDKAIRNACVPINPALTRGRCVFASYGRLVSAASPRFNYDDAYLTTSSQRQIDEIDVNSPFLFDEFQLIPTEENYAIAS